MALFVLGCSGPQTPPITWEASPDAIAEGRFASIQVRASGALALAYAAPAEAGGVEVFYRTSHDEGDHFSPPQQISQAKGRVVAHGESAPVLRLGARGEILVAWQQGREIHVGRSVDFGRSFGASVRVSDHAGVTAQGFHTMEVSPSGTVHVAWLDGRDGPSALYTARSSDGGASFETAIRVQSGVCPCCRPAVGFGEADRVVVSWRHVYPGHERSTVIAGSDDGGRVWSTPSRMPGDRWVIDGCPHSGPAIDVRDGEVDLVWYHGGDGRARLRHSRARESLREVRAFRHVEGPALDAVHPRMGHSGARRWLVFDGRRPDGGGGYGATRVPWLLELRGEQSASRPVPLPTLAAGASYPDVAGDSAGHVYVVWTETGDAESRIVLLRGRVNAGD